MQGDSILSYADETIIITSDDMWSSVSIKINEYLEIVSKWLAINKLSLNSNHIVFLTMLTIEVACQAK